MAGYVFPTDIVPQTASWGLVRQDVNQPSPLSGAVKRLVRGNAAWRASAEWSTLPTREKAQRLSAFLAQAGRGDNVIAFSDPAYTAQGAVSGVLQVAGASQTGTSLAIDGCVAGATVFASGDYFTVGGEMKQTTAPCIATAAGTAIVYFEPALRASPTDNAFLYVLTPWAPMYMPEGGFSFGHRPPKLSGLALQFAEAIGSESETVGPYIDLVRGRNDLAAISPLLTVTRASSKYLLSAAGTLATFGSNVAGFVWSSAAALLGLDVEDARTNLHIRSAELDDAAWTKTNASISANATTAPDGTSTADKLVEDASAGVSHLVRTNSALTVSSGVLHTNSIYAKAGERTWIRVAEETGVTAAAWFNLGTGAVGTVTGTGSPTASIKAIGNGWYRCSLMYTSSGTSARLRAYLATGDAVTTYTGDGTSGAYLWGAQVEAGPYPSSYIPTTTVSVTRAADVISVSSISTALGFSATEGTIYCEFSYPYVEASAAAVRSVWSVSDGTGNERALLYTESANADVDFALTDGGVSQAALDGPSVTADTALKTAIAWRANSIAFYASGVSVGADSAATLPTVTTLNIGAAQAGTQQGFVRIKNLRYYPRKLSATELATLTT